MVRPSRRLSIALLWLAIALLPLRGWAATWMTPFVAVDGAAAAVVVELPPCHGSAAAHHDGGPAAEPLSAAPTCAMCDLCHAQALQAPEAPALAPAPAQTPPPAAAPAPIEPRAPDALYRPPRPLAA